MKKKKKLPLFWPAIGPAKNLRLDCSSNLFQTCLFDNLNTWLCCFSHLQWSCICLKGRHVKMDIQFINSQVIQVLYAASNVVPRSVCDTQWPYDLKVKNTKYYYYKIILIIRDAVTINPSQWNHKCAKSCIIIIVSTLLNSDLFHISISWKRNRQKLNNLPRILI